MVFESGGEAVDIGFGYVFENVGGAGMDGRERRLLPRLAFCYQSSADGFQTRAVRGASDIVKRYVREYAAVRHDVLKGSICSEDDKVKVEKCSWDIGGC